MTEDILNRLEKRYAAGTKLLSNHRDRELLSLATFLELSGIKFKAAQLKPSSPDPPDVIFQPAVSSQRQQKSCDFEVTELLDPNTERNDAMWKAHKMVESAIVHRLSFQDYVLQRDIVLKQKTAITFDSLFELIRQRVDEKHKKYEKRKLKIQDIDLLVDIQFKSIFLKPNQKIFCPDDAIIKRWRSISFLMAPYCGVIYLSKYATKVLRDIHRRGLICVNDRPELWDEVIKKLDLPY